MLELTKFHTDWTLGFLDAVWWSREATPVVHFFAQKEHPPRVLERQVPSSDKTQKAIACYGMLFRSSEQPTPQSDAMCLRFIEQCPVSEMTIQY